MKSSFLALFLVASLMALPASADTEIRSYDVDTVIDFDTLKPAWYESAYVHMEEDKSLPFEVALDNPEDIEGEWSMHFTNPEARLSDGVDLSSKLLYVGMRYKFE